MSKKNASWFDAAGWLFWSVCFFVLLGPAVWGCKQIVFESVGWYTLIAISAIAAAIGAGVISWAVNTILQHRQRKLQIAERKKAKKKR